MLCKILIFVSRRTSPGGLKYVCDLVLAELTDFNGDISVKNQQ